MYLFPLLCDQMRTVFGFHLSLQRLQLTVYHHFLLDDFVQTPSKRKHSLCSHVILFPFSTGIQQKPTLFFCFRISFILSFLESSRENSTMGLYKVNRLFNVNNTKKGMVVKLCEAMKSEHYLVWTEDVWVVVEVSQCVEGMFMFPKLNKAIS